MPAPESPPRSGRVLIADADSAAVDDLRRALAQDGIQCRGARSAEETLRVLDEAPIDVLILDSALPSDAEPDLLATLQSRWPSLPLILATGDASVARAIACVGAGSGDFVVKPFVREEALFAVRKALERVARTLDFPPPPGEVADTLFGESAVMKEALEILRHAAPGNATVLVRGESGTGKELAARAIHQQSARKTGPFVKIDCASLPEQLLESELFGYEKGAFTGAVSRKPGRVEFADGGTLFLDEIGELTGPTQAKLLRLLQDREFERLGAIKTIKVDVRVVAATHRDLETMVERGQFRQDLFYRVNVVPVWLPPLRARRDDVDLLVKHFCAVTSKANRKSNVRIDEPALRLLRRQRWPGNVRQLQNFVERLVVLNDHEEIGEDQVRTELERQVKFVTQAPTTHVPVRARPEAAATHTSVVLALEDELWAAEKAALERALHRTGGNRSQAARLLGISRSTLYAKLEQYELL